MTTKEVADALGKSTSTVRRMAIPYFKAGGMRLYHLPDVEPLLPKRKRIGRR